MYIISYVWTWAYVYAHIHMYKSLYLDNTHISLYVYVCADIFVDVYNTCAHATYINVYNKVAPTLKCPHKFNVHTHKYKDT